MLQVKDLTKIYKTKSGVETTAVNHLTADFGDHGLIFVLGKSGCGKTTLLNLLGGLDAPTSGEIVIDGKPRSSFTEKENADYRNKYIGFVFQEYNLVDEFTVGGNISLALELQGEKRARERIDEALRAVGLVDGAGRTLYERRTNELSGGQKQRVAIARALIKEPRVILADEPTGALDSETGNDIYKLLKELSKEKLVIVVTHDVEAAPKYGDRTIELSDGKIQKDEGMPENGVQSGEVKREIKRGQLSFGRSFQLGATALRHKPLRLFFSILLAVMAFVLFAVSFTASEMNIYKIDLNTLKEKGLSYYCLQLGDQNRLPILNEAQNGKIVRVDYGMGIGIMGSLPSEALYDGFVALSRNGHCTVKLTSDISESDLGITPDERFIDKSLCRLPQAEGEIAITDILAQSYMYYGFVDKDEVNHEITTPDDLIGLEFSYGSNVRKIVGVYETEVDREALVTKYHGKKANELMDDEEYYALYYSIDYSIGCFTFVFDESEDYAYCLMKYDNNLNETLALLEDMNKVKEKNSEDVEIRSVNYNQMQPLVDIVMYAVPVMRIVTVVLILFSIGLTINFLLANLDKRKKQIGVLRAMGARQSDIVKICLAESGCIAAIEFMLSLVFTLIVCKIINAKIALSVMAMSFIGGVLLFLMVFGTTLLATILPAYLTVRKKPVDILSER